MYITSPSQYSDNSRSNPGVFVCPKGGHPGAAKNKGGITMYNVMTPGGPGIVWGIDKGKVLVEMEFSYLVEYNLGDVEAKEARP